MQPSAGLTFMRANSFKTLSNLTELGESLNALANIGIGKLKDLRDFRVTDEVEHPGRRQWVTFAMLLNPAVQQIPRLHLLPPVPAPI